MDKGRSTKVLQLLQGQSPFVPGRSQAASIPKQNRRFHPETPTGLKSTREYFYPSRMIDNKTSGRNPILKDLLYLIVCGGLFAAATLAWKHFHHEAANPGDLEAHEKARQRRNPEISSMSNSPRADCFIDPQQEGESKSLGEGCPHLVDLGRRHFLKSVAMAATVAVVPRGVAQTASKSVANTSAMSPPQAGAVYPSNRLGTLKDLQLNTPIAVTYPDAASPGVLLKLGHRVEGGVGPDADIVAFSTLCAHKGYPLNYNATSRTLNCPGHYSVYDVEKGGLEVWGHAAQNLAQFRLRVDANTGDIFAEGVDELIYGRTGNVLA